MTMLLQYIQNKLRRHFSPIFLVVGKQRTGKTYLALRMAYELEGEKFNTEEQMFFDVYSYLKAMSRFSGRVLIIDEAGIELDNFRSGSQEQRSYAHVIQSNAYKNNVLFIICPFASEISKSHRKHIDGVVHVVGRGCYKLYSAFSWHADLNDTKIRMTHQETIYNVPMPPANICNIYKSRFEQTMKQSILDREIAKFEKRNNPKQENKENFDSLADILKTAQ